MLHAVPFDPRPRPGDKYQGVCPAGSPFFAIHVHVVPTRVPQPVSHARAHAGLATQAIGTEQLKPSFNSMSHGPVRRETSPGVRSARTLSAGMAVLARHPHLERAVATVC